MKYNNIAASDIYFTLREDKINNPGYTEIYITPIDYFEENKVAYDDHLDMNHLLPPGKFECLMECVYGYEASEVYLKHWMLSKGFKESNEFSSLMDNV